MRAKALGHWYTWKQPFGNAWLCRRTDWLGRPLDMFIGTGATADEAYADLQAKRNVATGLTDSSTDSRSAAVGSAHPVSD